MDLEATLKEALGEEELGKAIASKMKEYHGLLTKEVALRLVAKEKGMLKEEERKLRIKEIPKEGKRLIIDAIVRKVWPVAKYSSGKCSRVIEISDETGSKPLVLWNEDVELGKSLRARDEITVKGAYERSGELHLGYSGAIDMRKKAELCDLSALVEGKPAHIRGIVTKIDGLAKEPTSGRNAFTFIISDGTNEKRCRITSGLDRANKLGERDEVMLEDAVPKGDDIEINHSTRMLCRKSNMLIGTIDALSLEEDMLKATVGGKTLSLERENALRFLGIDAADDIRLGTVFELKKESVINSKIAVMVAEKDGRTVVSR